MFKLWYDYIISVIATLVVIIVPLVGWYYISKYEGENQKLIETISKEKEELEAKYRVIAEIHKPYLIWEVIEKERGIAIDMDVLHDILDFHKNNSQYDLSFILAIIEKESTFIPTAMSSKAIGLMQIHYAVWKKEFNIKSKYDLFKPRYNLEIGFKIIEYYKKRHPDEDLLTILFFYNNGESGKYNNVYYGMQVLRLQKKYKKILNEVNRRIHT